MPLPLSLDAVADELDGLMDDMTAFVNRKTGELASISGDDASLIDQELNEEDLPDWQVEMVPKLREILECEDWAPLPTKFDVHEWEIMRKFVDSVADNELASRLRDAIHGPGAFRMFRTVVEDARIRDKWFDFKREVLRRIAKDALEELGIPYR